MYDNMIGKNVLIRANKAGVWLGLLLEADGHILKIEGRRLWSWRGALDCSVLAVRGPTSAKAGDLTTVVLGPSAEIVEVHAASEAAAIAVSALPEWSS